MDKKQAEKRIKELRKQVEYQAKRYYEDDKPALTAMDYDKLRVQ